MNEETQLVLWMRKERGAYMAKSSASVGNSNCVNVWKDEHGQVHVEDTKLGDKSPSLIFTEDEWMAFEWGFLNGEFFYNRLEVKS
jgi:hypothetical protein